VHDRVPEYQITVPGHSSYIAPLWPDSHLIYHYDSEAYFVARPLWTGPVTRLRPLVSGREIIIRVTDDVIGLMKMLQFITAYFLTAHSLKAFT